MAHAYIVDAIRTPGGRRNGALSNIHPADLAAHVLDRLVERTAIPADQIEDVILGCVSQSGAQSTNIARNAILSSTKIPESVPGVTVDRQCGSSQQAIQFAAQAVMSGTQDLIIAGGVESMSIVPIGSNVKDAREAGHGQPYASEGIARNYKTDWFHQLIGAELIAEEWGISREAIDEFALASHRKAAFARDAGHFNDEVVPIFSTTSGAWLNKDEGIRDNSSLEALAGLNAISDGVVTAGNASQITDGASAVLIASQDAVDRLGLKPRAKIKAFAVAAADPVRMLTGPIPATKKVLEKAGMSIDDIDLYEVNEAFAQVPMIWAKEVGADLDRLNVNGGAVALGHALGSTGSRLFTTLINELERRDAKYGLVAVCESGGLANATIIERVAE